MSVATLVSHLTAIECDWMEGCFLGEIEVVPPSLDDGLKVEALRLTDLLETRI